MNLHINKMTLEDLYEIQDILLSDFDDFWNYNILKDELKCDTSHFIVAKNVHNEIVGFAGFKVIVDEADIMNIVVKKDYRNQGVGNFLLNNLINLIRENHLNLVTLEVNEKNLSAIHLYKKFDFQTLGIRKNYYNGVDNAVIMNKKMNY